MQQEYTRIGQKIASQFVEYDPDSQSQDIRFLLPNELSSYEKQLIYMSIQVRDFPLLAPASYNSTRPISNLSENTLVLWEKDQNWISSEIPIEILDLYGETYKLRVY